MQQTNPGKRRLIGVIKTSPANPAPARPAPTPNEPWVRSVLETPSGPVPVVSTRLTWQDRLGSWKARWGINRMNYRVQPGLYAVGQPDPSSPVLVTANYKMTFDCLRRELTGLSVWILVLDTKGVNVWCAAGKGTFGTKELIRRLRLVRLEKLVTHRTLILPQLGAPGIKAHEVGRETGFHVVYGPVRASDIPAFLAAGQQASPAMRQVRFNLADRFVLTPMELVSSIKPALIGLGVLFILNAAGLGHYGLTDLIALLGALICGCVLTPVLLPILPGRMFAVKGIWPGLIWALAINLIGGWPAPSAAVWLKALAFFLILPGLSAFEAMNFTGCSTYTSLSGVNQEMRRILPILLIIAGLGAALLLAGDIVRLVF